MTRHDRLQSIFLPDYAEQEEGYEFINYIFIYGNIVNVLETNSNYKVMTASILTKKALRKVSKEVPNFFAKLF